MQKSGDIENKSAAESIYLTDEQKKLVELKKSLKDTKPLGNLVSLCRTLDQASSVMQMVDNISEKSLKSTISLTAGRGRGKSAALGIALSSKDSALSSAAPPSPSKTPSREMSKMSKINTTVIATAAAAAAAAVEKVEKVEKVCPSSSHGALKTT